MIQIKPEPTTDTLWQTWKSDPSPENLRNTVEALRPSMEVALHGVGGSQDPYLRAKARTIAAEAVRTYDPAGGAKLPTWTTQQLMRLRRLKRQSSAVVPVPERIQLDNYTLEQASARFQDLHDREPDVEELADLTKLPVRRIEHIRRTVRATPSEAAFADAPIVSDENAVPDYMPEAVSIVFEDVDRIDRKILEMKTGYGGHEILPPAEVARRLNLTPSQLSRRAAKLSYQIQKAEADLQTT